ADITPQEIRGAAYGLRQSMDTVGAFAGPMLAILLMYATHDNFRLVFWVAAVPAFICVLLIIYGVEEPESVPHTPHARLPISRASLRRLPHRFWFIVVFAAVLTLARFSEAFLLMRAQSLGLSVTWVPMILIVMNVVYAASAYPLGKLSDNGSRHKLLVWGIVFLVAADLILAVAGTVWVVVLGAAVWGLHMGATQGLLSALVADAAPPDLRGTAFGVFNLASGAALLAASIIAGSLWSLFGPAMTFYAGAAFSFVALAGLLAGTRKKWLLHGN
ncbi:MAG: MFS transporter, partial [Geobacteraceae bacterium]|nr:MFS transporter [Geobacteraceae bacterium]